MNSPFPTYRPSRFEFQIIVTEGDKTFTLPLTDISPGFNFTVYWGDNNSNKITTYNDVNRIHTYSTAGTYNIKIIGLCAGFQFYNGGDKLKIKKVISWGDVGFRQLDFYGCSNLNSLPNEKGRLPNLTVASDMFRGCSSLVSIPSGIFDGSVNIILFNNTFESSGITSIPTDIFKYNTAAIGFNGIFVYCSGITSIPTDLFRYNTLVTDFAYVFLHCSGITSIPTDLFRYNTLVTTFDRTFQGCSKAQCNINIFYATGEEGTRFLNKTINFTNCFTRSSFSGIQGIAPDLWNCNFGTGSATKTNCYSGDGNSLTSLSNYNDIPSDWK